VFVWYIPDSVAVFVGLRATRSCTSSTTSYAGRKKSNPTEMLGKVFPALSTAAAAAVNTHPQAPRTIAADQCRHRTELLETRWPNERAGGPTGHSTPCDRVGLGCENGGDGSHCCAARGTCHGSRSKWIFSKASLLKTCFVCRIFFHPLSFTKYVCVCMWSKNNEIFNHKIKSVFFY